MMKRRSRRIAKEQRGFLVNCYAVLVPRTRQPPPVQLLLLVPPTSTSSTSTSTSST